MTRSALIIASSSYADPKLRQLRAPQHDAVRLAEVLSDPEIGAFDVMTCVDEPEYAVRRKLASFFGRRGRDDLLLAHFSCHGLKDEDGQLYFATTDTEIEQLEATAVSADFVNRLMNRSLSRRIVLLLDCCYAGAFGRGATARAGGGVDLKERFDGRGRVVITASNSMEYAFEGDDLTGRGTPSIFTSAVVEGLRSGAADIDGDGHVSVDDLYDHVYEQVRERTPNQTPSKWTYDVQGELFVARSPVGPVAKPDEAEPLQEAAEGLASEQFRTMTMTFTKQSPSQRQHAVRELKRVTAGMALEELYEFAESPHTGYRVGAAVGLRVKLKQSRDLVFAARFLRLLRALLRDESSFVRYRALEVVLSDEKLGSQVEPEVRSLAENDANRQVRGLAERALARIQARPGLSEPRP